MQFSESDIGEIERRLEKRRSDREAFGGCLSMFLILTFVNVVLWLLIQHEANQDFELHRLADATGQYIESPWILKRPETK